MKQLLYEVSDPQKRPALIDAFSAYIRLERGLSQGTAVAYTGDLDDFARDAYGPQRYERAGASARHDGSQSRGKSLRIGSGE